MNVRMRMAAGMAGVALAAGALRAEGEIKIGAILAVTGPDAVLGVPQARTLEMQVEEINGGGGVRGQKLRLFVKDSGGDYEKAAALARQLIDTEHVLAIVGPTTSGEAMTLKPLCQESGTVLLSCASAGEVVNPVASWVFQTAPDSTRAAALVLQTIRSLGYARIGLAVDDSFDGQAGRLHLQELAPTNGIKIVDVETYDRNATNLTAVLAKLKAARDLDAIVNWSVTPAQAVFPRAMNAMNITLPLFQGPGFGSRRLVRQAGLPAEGILFPGGRLLVPDSLPAGNPQKALLVRYRAAYEKSTREEVSCSGGYAWDALSILCAAVYRAAATEPAKVRDALENLKGFTGTTGVFTFSPGDHGGLGPNTLQMLTVSNGSFAVYQAPAKKK